MAKKTPEEIEAIVKAYEECGTYSGAAKLIGCAASTVKKYVMEAKGAVNIDIKPQITKPEKWGGRDKPIEMVKTEDIPIPYCDLGEWIKMSKEEEEEALEYSKGLMI